MKTYLTKMAIRCINFSRIIRNPNVFKYNSFSTSIHLRELPKLPKVKEYKTENNFVYLEDPNTFGNLSGSIIHNDTLDEKGDIKEEQYLQNVPLKTQKLTIKQYADLIKQYLKHKRLKEAIDILEVRMLKDDKVKPENYIYNILIGACADVGYTKKAFKLFNDMKRRALKPTGDTYTCLFHACANSPWTSDALKNAHHLRNLMIEKGIEPNLTNYNAMIKAFGRCGDIKTSFQIVDEMISKKFKIRVHTFNHLLHACISDKETGLRHALVVWRKMLTLREKPNIYTFNLMLKCVKECNIGTKKDIEELINVIGEHTRSDIKKINNVSNRPMQIELIHINTSLDPKENVPTPLISESGINKEEVTKNKDDHQATIDSTVEVAIIDNDNIRIQKENKNKERTIPNLLSKVLQMQNVFSLQEVHTVQDKFAIIGGQDDFLNEMKTYSIKPDVKTFSQMLLLLEETNEAENKLIEIMKSEGINADIDFYNMLIKKRCFRSNYNGALDVKEMIENENKHRKRKYPLKKKLRLKMDIMTYGALAMACKTKEDAERLLNEIKEKQLKVNIEILGAMLRQGTTHSKFGYVLYIMNVVKQENLQVNDIFIKHLEQFNDKCINIIKQDVNEQTMKCTPVFIEAYKKFSYAYNKWLKDMNVEEALKPEHPWQQFREPYPETFQRQNFEIKEPKRFYKRNRKYVTYKPSF